MMLVSFCNMVEDLFHSFFCHGSGIKLLIFLCVVRAEVKFFPRHNEEGCLGSSSP
jgi:hypothetical protein